jgi:hypothetical protein
MHKGIMLQIWVKVEGEQEAPEDFETLATKAVQRVIAAGAAQETNDLTFEVTTIQATEDPPDDENEQHA